MAKNMPNVSALTEAMRKAVADKHTLTIDSGVIRSPCRSAMAGLHSVNSAEVCAPARVAPRAGAFSACLLLRQRRACFCRWNLLLQQNRGESIALPGGDARSALRKIGGSLRPCPCCPAGGAFSACHTHLSTSSAPAGPAEYCTCSRSSCAGTTCPSAACADDGLSPQKPPDSSLVKMFRLML